MRTSLLILALALASFGCADKEAKQEQAFKKLDQLHEVYSTGDLRTAEQALIGLEAVMTNELKAFFGDRLLMEVAYLRLRRSQISERLGDHARAEQLIGEALAFTHLAGHNTNYGATWSLKAVEEIDASQGIKWRQSTN